MPAPAKPADHSGSRNSSASTCHRHRAWPRRVPGNRNDGASAGSTASTACSAADPQSVIAHQLLGDLGGFECAICCAPNLSFSHASPVRRANSQCSETPTSWLANSAWGQTEPLAWLYEGQLTPMTTEVRPSSASCHYETFRFFINFAEGRLRNRVLSCSNSEVRW